MLSRLRLRAGVYASALLLLIGVALIASATEPITRSQAESMIDARLGAAALVVFGAFWVLLLTISGRSEKALAASIGRLEIAVEKFTTDLTAHNGSLYAHGAAFEHAHAPLLERTLRIEGEVGRVGKEVERVEKGLVDFIDFCKRHQCALGERNPMDSPHKRRATDEHSGGPDGTGVDFRDLRAKARKTDEQD